MPASASQITASARNTSDNACQMPLAFEIPSTPARIQTSGNPRETPKSRHQPTSEFLEK